MFTSAVMKAVPLVSDVSSSVTMPHAARFIDVSTLNNPFNWFDVAIYVLVEVPIR